MFTDMSESGENVHEYESTLRYLSSKSPLSERRLAIASLKSLTLYDISMFPYLSESGEDVHEYESTLRYLSPKSVSQYVTFLQFTKV